MIKRTIAVFLFTVVTYTAFSQKAEFDNRCAKAYDHMLALQLDKAETLLNQEAEISPENVYISYLRNYIGFIQLFISQDEELYDELSSKKAGYFAKVEKLNDSCPYKKWMLGNMHLQWSVNKIIFGDLLTGAFELSRAYYLIMENREQFPEFKPDMLSMGVLHVIFGLVPDKYDWLLNLFTLEGDVEKGKKELSGFLALTEQEQSLRYLYTETLFFSGFIELNVHTDNKKLDELLEKTEQMNDSVMLIRFLQLNILMKTGRNEDALELFATIDSLKQTAYPFVYLDYLHGESLLRALNYSEAVEKYDLFLNRFKGENYIKDAWRKKAWAAFLSGDSMRYIKNMEQVISHGASRLEIDKDALREAQSGKFPDAALLLARLLFDGGYYTKALDILDKDKFWLLFSTEKTAQYYYRLGRIYEQLGKKEEAQTNYLLTIQYGYDMDDYYAANATLKLGEMYEDEGNYGLARESYKQCLEMDFEPYRNSISARAKEGLRRVSGKDR
jgi:tetratricopeptide (TPR) repeat protein